MVVSSMWFCASVQELSSTLHTLILFSSGEFLSFVQMSSYYPWLLTSETPFSEEINDWKELVHCIMSVFHSFVLPCIFIGLCWSKNQQERNPSWSAQMGLKGRFEFPLYCCKLHNLSQIKTSYTKWGVTLYSYLFLCQQDEIMLSNHFKPNTQYAYKRLWPSWFNTLLHFGYSMLGVAHRASHTKFDLERDMQPDQQVFDLLIT